MQEAFLHYLWKVKYFNALPLTTLSGKRVQIIYNGFHNPNEGPDFKEAKIVLDDIEWNGSIEFHLKTSDWDAHQHSSDNNYDNVILHVVYQHDKQISAALELLELQSYIDDTLIEKSNELLLSAKTLPCASYFNKTFTSSTTKLWLDKMLLSRYIVKSEAIRKHLHACNGVWEMAFYRLLFQQMGYKVNAGGMQMLFDAIPFKEIKHLDAETLKQFLLQLAGFTVPEASIHHLFVKHKLSPMNPVLWRTGSVRPSNHPIERIQQLCILVKLEPGLFAMTIHHQVSEVLVAEMKRQKLSKSLYQHLLLNVCIPFQLFWRRYNQLEDAYDLSLLEPLENIPFEKNAISKVFVKDSNTKLSAYYSQAFLYLHSSFCLPKRCLECAIGNAFLRS